MRKLILAGFVLFSTVVAQAQIEKGDRQLGGTVSWNNLDLNGNSRSILTISPQAGLFLSDITSLGLTLGFNSQTNSVPDNLGNSQDITNNLFQFGVYARFHKPIVENFYLFLEPAISLGSGKNETFNGPKINVNTFNIGLRPGLTYFMTPKFALELRLGGLSYNRQKDEFNGTDTTIDNFSFVLNLANAGLGLNYYLR